MPKLTKLVLKVSLIFLVIWTVCINKAEAKEPNVDSPKISKTKIELTQAQKQEKSIDELLGPKDIYPFLPDNHRDSGTGKFAAFE